MWHVHLKCCLWIQYLGAGGLVLSCLLNCCKRKPRNDLNDHQQGSGWIHWDISRLWNFTHLYKKSVRYGSTDLEGVPNVLLNEKAGCREMSATTISFFKKNNKNSPGMCLCLHERWEGWRGESYLPVNFGSFGVGRRERDWGPVCPYTSLCCMYA